MKTKLKVRKNNPRGFGEQISDVPIQQGVPKADINFIWVVLFVPSPRCQDKIVYWSTDYDQARDYKRTHRDCMVAPLARCKDGKAWHPATEEDFLAAEEAEEIQESKNQEAESLISQAVNEAQLGMYLEALKNLNQVIQLNPKIPAAYYYRGQIWADMAQFKAAIADFNRVIYLQPDYPGVYVDRGMVFANLGNLSKAIESCNCAVADHPNVDAYIARGTVRARLSDYLGAVSDFTEAIHFVPESLDGYAGQLFVGIKPIQNLLFVGIVNLVDIRDRLKIQENTAGYKEACDLVQEWHRKLFQLGVLR